MTLPSDDELEITVMGRGYGESIVIHYGNGNWAIIDSFIHPDAKTPCALKYLKDIGVNVEEDVQLVIATHADSDHIQGIAETYRQCKQAKFVFSNILTNSDLQILINNKMPSNESTQDGTKVRREELYEVVQEIGQRKRDVPTKIWREFANAHSDLLVDTVTINKIATNRQVRALSPSASALTKGYQYLAKIIKDLRDKVDDPNKKYPKTSLQPLDNNHTSIALWIKIGDRRILLGADLEEIKNDPTDGWTGILNSGRVPEEKAEFFKIPHHGSNNAHCHEVWERMVVNEDNHSIVTPFSKGKTLPQETDIERICNYSPNAYMAGSSKVTRKRYSHEIDNQLRKKGKIVKKVVRGYGRCTLRTKIHGKKNPWDISQEGETVNLNVLSKPANT